MTRQEILQGLIDIMQNIPQIKNDNLKNVNEDTDFITDLGAPSTELINIMAKAEDKFGLEFDDDDIDDLGSTVGDTIDLIDKTQREA